MRSATSCSKTLLRSDWRNYWPLAFLYSFISFFAMPVALWSVDGMSYYGQSYQWAGYIYDILPTFVGINLGLGVGLAMGLFGYLMNSRAVGLMHALPVTRTRQFLSHFGAGMSMLTAANVLTFSLALLAEALMGTVDPAPLLIWLLVTELTGFFFLAFGTLCVMATGWLMAVPVIYLGLNFVAAAYHGILSAMASVLYVGHPGYEEFGPVVEWLTPVIRIMRVLGATMHEEMYRRVTISEECLPTILIYTAVGVAMLAFAWALYRKRSSESAGDAIVFPCLRPVVKYVISVAAGLILGLAVYEIFLGTSPRYTGVSTVGAGHILSLVACQVIMGALAYCALEMMMRKAYKIFDRRTALGLAVLSAVLIAVCVAMRLDITGYQTRVPQPEEVTRVHVSGGGSFYLGGMSDRATIRATTELHRALTRGGVSEDGPFLHVAYDLKSGGLMRRQYRMDLNDPEVYRALTELLNVPENRILDPLPDRGVYGEEFTEGYAANYHTGKEFILTPEQCLALYRAMEEDGEAPIKPEDLLGEEKGWIYLTLTTNRGTYTADNLHGNCVRTLALLVEYGVMEQGELLG